MTEVEVIPNKPSAADKRAATDAAAQVIIEKEALDREKKTERLRALRLGQAAPPAKMKKR